MMRVVNLWKTLDWYLQEDQSPRWRDRHEAAREKQGVDSRDEVRHSEKTDQLFVEMTMKAEGCIRMWSWGQGQRASEQCCIAPPHSDR